MKNGDSRRGGCEGRHYLITGRVQGVGFRWWATRLAEGMELGGWVRNLRDGAVEVRVWGVPSALDRFEEHLAHGPRGARVETVTRHPVPEDASVQRRFSIVG